MTLSCRPSAGNTAGSSADTGSDQKMIDLLTELRKQAEFPENVYASALRVAFCDSVINHTADMAQRLNMQYVRATTCLELGDEERAVADFEDLLKQSVGNNAAARKQVLSGLGIAYLRLAERNNCVNGHTPDACIMPIQGTGIHLNKTGAEKAIGVYTQLLQADPNDLNSLWLLNIAYMTLGEYPAKVPKQWLIPNLDKRNPVPVKAFVDIGADLKVMTNDRSGGVIVDDFDNDGNLDIVTSAWGLEDPMHFFRNNGDGTFTDHSKNSGLDRFTGGLNMTSTDYNNDGFIDIFVLRGAWQGENGTGRQPNSLLRNNGDGTFTDVTVEAGLLSFHPTQTATWNDFNLDGWLDVFIGNESSSEKEMHPCELYLNNKNGTFTNIATPDNLDIKAFVKGVTSGDYDGDGWPDIFISTVNARQLLLHNKGVSGHTVDFELSSGLPDQGKETAKTFPAGFFDFDNDGSLDIFMCTIDFNQPLSYFAAKEALHPSDDITGKMFIYRNNGDGTFKDVTKQMNVREVLFGMGANFGDIDNDGWLDLYIGTGNPNYRSLIPNRLYKNMEGKKFADVTANARVGNLQKGHGVAFGDIDNDGDQDIFAEMGGAYIGDAYPSAFYLNPGRSENNWIALKLEGVQSNRAAIGAKVIVEFREKGKKRVVYREVNSGASFGCSPLRREIGIGKATLIDKITLVWPASKKVQTFTNVKPNQFITITEGADTIQVAHPKPLAFKKHDGSVMPMCAPAE